MTTPPPPHDLHDRAARLSLAVGVAVFSLKLGAWALTGSVALLSDALESVVNVVAAATMLAALRVARRPADADHPFGHGKAEYLSAFFEGALIAVAAVITVASAWGRLRSPAPAARVGEGIAVSVLASLANGALGMYLLRISRRTRSLALEADGRHVLADVYTSAGVIVGVTLARLTGWWRLDPLVAMAVAANILWVGWRLVRRSVGALLDELADPEEALTLERSLDALARELGARGVSRLRLRWQGPGAHADLRLRVDPAMSVGDAHALCDALEAKARALDARVELVVHVEPDAPTLRPP
ncbi:MAG: cation diffusion facilitator family transporter [Polyangiales bacterium]